MRYLKALVLVLIFFVAMIFLFQNQISLSQTLSFKLDLLFMPAMTSIELPFYFVLLAAFLLGALMCLVLLHWDRMRLSAQIMRANFRVQAMQNEEKKLLAQMEKLAAQPREGRLRLFFRKDRKVDEANAVESEEKSAEKSGDKPGDKSSHEPSKVQPVPAENAGAKVADTALMSTSLDNIEADQATDNLGRPAEAKA